MFGSNTDATGQTGEPNIAGSPADTTVWYSWTAPENGPTSFNLRDAGFDTTLHVFTGSTFGTLASVASNDDFNGALQSRVTFNASAGTTYRIAVDGFSAAHGAFSLQWAQNSPANDNFATPAIINGATGKSYTNTARSTGEPGEPNHGSIPDRSVWYSWTAPGDGLGGLQHPRVELRHSGRGLHRHGRQRADAAGGERPVQRVEPVADHVPGGLWDDVPHRHRRIRQYDRQPRPAVVDQPPANDSFSSPRVLPGLSGRRSGTTVRATGEPGELDYHGGAAADNSVWFTWAPTTSAPAVVRLVDVAGGLAPGIGVYTGDSLGALTSVGSDETEVQFDTVAGTTYRIAVDGNGGSTGTFNLKWLVLTPPAAPTVKNSTPLEGAVRVAFTPGSDGGSAITGFTAKCVSTNGGVTKTKTGTASPITVINLTGDKNYHCRVRARNAVGTGPYGPFGSIVRVLPTPPAAPEVKNTTPLDDAVRVAFTPGSDGGSAITGFTAQCASTDGGVTRTETGTASPITVVDLTSNRNYRCRVRATNAVGTASTAPTAPRSWCPESRIDYGAGNLSSTCRPPTTPRNKACAPRARVSQRPQRPCRAPSNDRSTVIRCR